MKSLIRRLTWLFQPRRRDAEIREELEFHLQEEAEQRKAEGILPQRALRDAHLDLGNVALLQENVRSVWIWTFAEQLIQDVRYALRVMMANKVFASLAVVSLALGIGANTAIYSFMDALLMRSLPVSDPGSLVVLNWHAQARAGADQRMSQVVPVVQAMSGTTYGDPTGPTAGIFPYGAFQLFQDQLSQAKENSPLASLFSYIPAGILNLTIKGDASLVRGEYVSGDYFRGLELPSLAGRLIIADDDRAGAPPVVVLSAALGNRTFGNAEKAVGQSILINNQPFTVVGITPPEFFGVDPAVMPEFYLPMHANVLLEGSGRFGPAQGYLDPHFYWIQIMGRLRPGVTLEQAQAFLGPLFHQWVAGTATEDRMRANLPVLALKEGAGGLDTLRRRFSKPLYLLLTLVGLILAIACANVANLLLARAAARQQEIALRLSLGAGRLRVMRQLLTESVFLASLGGIVGVLVAIWGIRFLTVLLATSDDPFVLHANLNWRVLGVTAMLSLLTGILFGLAPALRATRVDVAPALKKLRGVESAPGSHFNLSRLLVVSQIVLSCLLLVAAGLFVRTLRNLQSVELGFNRENMLLFELDARQAGHKDPEILEFYSDLQRKFSTLPGVHSVSLSRESLLDAGTGLPISVHGAPEDEDNRILFIGPDFFKTMQIPILTGRDLEQRDRPGSLSVAVINELFAQRNFGNQNPIGQHLLMNDENHPRDLEIVGVSRNAHYGPLRRSVPPVIYVPYDQGFPPPRQMVYVLRTAGDPLTYVRAVRQIVHQADPRLPLADVRTQRAEIDQTIHEEITFARLCTAFAGLALIIACVGLYGTVSYKVVRRTGEIGIRIALGAQRGAVVWLILREICLLAAIALALSLPVAFTASGLLESFLFDMKPNDPLAIVSAVATLLMAVLLAGFLPARKASRIDPMVALRHE
ncbi:MAG TPA: ABC transporter permease [Candidatus Angelobacter sp.]|nr:ABC transporter permease [Candidatus Angelobacter sp.]